MADPKEPRRKARFTGPGNYILWMVVFLAIVLALAAALQIPRREWNIQVHLWAQPQHTRTPQHP